MAKAESKKSKKLLQRRTNLEWTLLTILLAIIIFLLLALLNKWWPFNPSKFGNDHLGTAFYTLEAPNEMMEANKNTGNGSSNGNDGASGTAGSNGSNGSNNGGNTTNPPSSSSALLNFAAGLDAGNTKEETSGQASGLNENCAILVNSNTLGKQEVCTYTEGDKLVTVTYLNDHVISASRSGF